MIDLRWRVAPPTWRTLRQKILHRPTTSRIFRLMEERTKQSKDPRDFRLYLQQELVSRCQKNPSYSLKGQMGAQASSTSPSVFWRLPTLWDYQQANVDGIRFVMPDLTSTTSPENEWTATIVSNIVGDAWYFSGSINGWGISQGAGGIRSSHLAIRCVGR